MDVLIKNIRRLVCPHCGSYCDVCLSEDCPVNPVKNRVQNKKCVNCGSAITSEFAEVRWWHGREVPRNVDFWWSEKYRLEGRRVTEIPESYLEVNMYFAGLENRQISRHEALDYFITKAKRIFSNAEVHVVPDEEWVAHNFIKCPVFW